jgi:hypothetical protein
MQTLRENWAFLVLGLLAIILVILFVRLENAMMASISSQPLPNSQAINTTVTRWPTATLFPPTATFTVEPATPTSTLTTIPVLAKPTVTPTTLPVLPATFTPIPIVLPTLALEPTATATSQTVVSTATIAGQPVTVALLAPRVNYRLGHIDRGDRCATVATILQLILQQEFQQTVETVAFTQVDKLFLTLADPNVESRIDLTPCFIDPDDRDYLPKHFGFIIFVAGDYGKIAGKSYMLVSNGSLKKVLQREQPCLYRFLKEFRIDDTSLQEVDAAAWIADHSALIRGWTTCE